MRFQQDRNDTTRANNQCSKMKRRWKILRVTRRPYLTTVCIGSSDGCISRILIRSRYCFCIILMNDERIFENSQFYDSLFFVKSRNDLLKAIKVGLILFIATTIAIDILKKPLFLPPIRYDTLRYDTDIHIIGDVIRYFRSSTYL